MAGTMEDFRHDTWVGKCCHLASTDYSDSGQVEVGVMLSHEHDRTQSGRVDGESHHRGFPCNE